MSAVEQVLAASVAEQEAPAQQAEPAQPPVEDEIGEAHSVRVYVRFRPPNSREERAETDKDFTVRYSEDERGVQLLQTEPGKPSIERDYMFDRVFGPHATQLYVFQCLARPVVDDVVKGFNGTIFAYGQTGSGKTFSMYGSTSPEGKGMVPRCSEYLFDELQRNDEIRQVTIKCSFLEIYKEKIRDLLNVRGGGEPLKMRETTSGAMKVLGLIEEYVSSPEDIAILVAQGDKVRAVSATSMNDRSSRSHTVLTITVTQKLQDASIRVGKLHMADLAGSERVDKSGLVGLTLSEAKEINKSLSALGNCINALTDRTRSHVPFRDSKLTYLLKDSLGGNTKTSLLVTCSPHPANSDETLSALMFAQRARHVKNRVRVNRQLSVQELQTLVDRLRKQLAESRARIRHMQSEASRGGFVFSKFLMEDFDSDPALDSYGRPARHSTLPARPGQAAGLMYGAGGSFPVGVNPAEAKASERGIQQKTMPVDGRERLALEQTLELAAALADYPDLEQFGELEDSGLGATAPAGESIIASNSLTIKQRLAMRQQLIDGWAQQQQAGRNVYVAGEEETSLQRSDSSVDVVQRAKDAIKRSVASRSSAEPLEESSDDAEQRLVAKKRLQEELEAAKKRRESIREAQRRRADMWAAKRLESAHDGADPEAQEALVEDAAPLPEIARSQQLAGAQRAPAKDGAERTGDVRRRGPGNGLKVLTTNAPRGEELSQEIWSPIGSPIPPPPQYPYPVSPDASPKSRSGVSAADDSAVGADEARSMRSRSGIVQLRIVLVTDDDKRALGAIEVKGGADMKLEELRQRIVAELEDVPDSFIFTRKGVPVGLRQEKKRDVGYVANNHDAVYIRADTEPQPAP